LVVLAERLPSWLAEKRTLGAFYILRPLGSGATSSVFIAKRLEEKNAKNAELFALKVPDYSGAVARNLSEAEFLEYFRQEASALLGLPPSPHLAKFVTFDLAARPKPILVMELIPGPTLESFLARCFRATTKGRDKLKAGLFVHMLESVLDGLATMHQHGIGHLDLKPGNVILRDSVTPTLVDFGLSGRHIRPGCATGPYGAPEIWGGLPDDFVGDPSPCAADIYAFGALCFEVLTGQVLFESATEVGSITQHLTHNGHPKRLDRLAAIRPLTELLEHLLEPDPRKRWAVTETRRALQALAPHIEHFAWPLGVSAA
jgi:serine/threonine protein kinase